MNETEDLYTGETAAGEFEENIVDIRGRKVAVSERVQNVKTLKGIPVCRIQAWSMFYKSRTGNEIYSRDEVLECLYSAIGCLRCEENYLDLSAEQASILVSEGDFFIKTSNGEHFVAIESYEDLRSVLKHVVGGTRIDEFFEQFCEKNMIIVDDSLEDRIDLEQLDFSLAANK